MYLLIKSIITWARTASGRRGDACVQASLVGHQNPVSPAYDSSDQSLDYSDDVRSLAGPRYNTVAKDEAVNHIGILHWWSIDVNLKAFL